MSGRKHPGPTGTRAANVKAPAGGAGSPGSPAASLSNLAPDLLAQVVDVVKVCVECHKEIERCKTERVRFSETARVQVEQIRSRRDILVQFMDHTFKERKENFEALFARLDTTLEQGNTDGARAVLDTIVTIAKSSPFEALRDAASAHNALLDKNVTWEF